MSDTADHSDDRALAGEYALGLLPDAERDAFEARLVAEPELRALYRIWSEDFARLAEDVDPVSPPAHVQRRIEQQLFDAPDAAGWARWLPGWAWGGLAVAGLAALLLFGGDLMQRGPQMPSAPAFIAEIAAEDRSLIVQAAYDAEGGALHVQREAGEARPGRALELWLIVGSSAPVSLGVLSGEGHTVLAISDLQRGTLEGALLAISDEPPGGSPTGAPTGDVLGVGPITDT